jgi:FtsH-binding integral membrane protein
MNSSSIPLQRVSAESRQLHLNFLKVLYFLFGVELLIQVIWTSFAINYFDELGVHIRDRWEFALIAAVIVGFILVTSFCLQVYRRMPINVIIYCIFTLALAYLSCWLALVDKYLLIYFAMWVLFMIAIAYTIYSWATYTYLKSFISIIVVLAPSVLVLLGFLIFSEIRFMRLILMFVGVLIYGFYLNYDIRKMVVGGASDYGREDPWIGAVQIWVEALVVVVRVIELFARGLIHQ